MCDDAWCDTRCCTFECSRNDDDAAASRRLGRTDHLPAAAQRGHLPDNPDGSGGQVDVAVAQRGQLAPPQAAEDREQDEPAIALIDRLDQSGDVRHGEHLPLG